jgi:hypothetical protein
MKKYIIWLLTAFIAITLVGCSEVISFEASTDDNTTDNLQRLSCIKIYSATNQTLINTIEDKDILIKFIQNTTFAEQWTNTGTDDSIDQQEKIRQKLEDYEPQYIITSYKTPAAIINDGNLEKISDITIYKDTNIIKMQISPDTIKAYRIPSEYLTDYFEITDEVRDFLISLTGVGNQ